MHTSYDSNHVVTNGVQKYLLRRFILPLKACKAERTNGLEMFAFIKVENFTVPCLCLKKLSNTLCRLGNYCMQAHNKSM